MRSLIPKSLKDKQTAYELRWLFESDATKTTRDRVMNFFAEIYLKHAFLKNTEIPNTIVEEFFIPMATPESYESEISLCDAIGLHSERAIDDASVKYRLVEFYETHCFVYQPDGTRRVKKGALPSRPQDTPVWLFQWYREHLGQRFAMSYVCNAIQVWLVYLLEQKLGDCGGFRCTPLQ